MGGSSGDRSDDFAQLLAEHQTRLFGYIYAIIPNMTDAEDVYQDTVLTLWQRFNDYQVGTNLRAGLASWPASRYSTFSELRVGTAFTLMTICWPN